MNILMMFYFLFSLIYSGVAEAPRDAQQAIHSLQDESNPGKILLILDEFPELYSLQEKQEKINDQFKKLPIENWEGVCQQKWHDVNQMIDRKRLNGRPDVMELYGVYDVSSELVGYFNRLDLASLLKDNPLIRRQFSWVGFEKITPYAVQDTDQNLAHHFRSFIKVKEKKSFTLEIDHRGAWMLMIGDGRWFQSKLAMGVPDRVLVSVTLEPGRYPINLVVQGSYEFDLRLKQNEIVSWISPFAEGEGGDDFECHIEPQELPVLKYIKEDKSLRTRWLIRQNLGDLLSAQKILWHEALRLIHHTKLSNEKGFIERQLALDLVLKKEPKHVKALVQSARLARLQSMSVEAGILIDRALKESPNDPHVLIEAIQVSLSEKKTLKADYLFKKLQELYPHWEQTKLANMLLQLHAPMSREKYIQDLPLYQLRQYAHDVRSLPVKYQAFQEIARRCPWEARAQLKCAQIDYQMNRSFDIENVAICPKKDEFVKSISKKNDFEGYFSEFVPEKKLFQLSTHFPLTDSALLYDLMAIRFEEDGSAHEVVHQLIRIHTDVAIEEFSSVPLMGEPELMRVITPDGREWLPLMIPGQNEITFPRLVKGSLIEMRTHRRVSAQSYYDYDSTRFYFRDPERKSVLSHSLVVLEYPENFSFDLVPHQLEDLGTGSEYYAHTKEVKGDYVQEVWQAKDMQPKRSWPHRLPVEKELPYIRVAGHTSEQNVIAHWLENSDLWTQYDRETIHLTRKITADTFGPQERLQALFEWNKKNIIQDSGLRGIWTIQNRSGDVNISLATLLRAAGFEAYLFHCRLNKRFFDHTDRIERNRGYWPGVGVVAFVGDQKYIFVPERPWLKINEIPEMWQGQRIRYWRDHRWQTHTLSFPVQASSQRRTVTFDVANQNFQCIEERSGDALEQWSNFLWQDNLFSRRYVQGSLVYPELIFKDIHWHRSSQQHLQLHATGDLNGVKDQGWKFPAINATKTWLPEGSFDAPLWISTDRVTVDRVHFKLTPEIVLTGHPLDHEEVHQGFLVRWQTKRLGDDLWIERTWQHKAGLIGREQHQELINFFKRVDALDRRRLFLKKKK